MNISTVRKLLLETQLAIGYLKTEKIEIPQEAQDIHDLCEFAIEQYELAERYLKIAEKFERIAERNLV